VFILSVICLNFVVIFLIFAVLHFFIFAVFCYFYYFCSRLYYFWSFPVYSFLIYAVIYVFNFFAVFTLNFCSVLFIRYLQCFYRSLFFDICSFFFCDDLFCFYFIFFRNFICSKLIFWFSEFWKGSVKDSSLDLFFFAYVAYIIDACRIKTLQALNITIKLYRRQSLGYNKTLQKWTYTLQSSWTKLTLWFDS